MSHQHLLSVSILTLFAVSLARGDDRRLPITPKQWRPDVAAAIEWLEQDLQETKAQQGMNRLSRRIADLKDAQLFTVYVRLAEYLSAADRQKLRQEQEEWLSAREKYAEDHIESHGGSLAPLEANTAEIEFTEKRIVELTKRLATYEHEKT
jgi:uncharacterized protein YecT (DUF1311 family)